MPSLYPYAQLTADDLVALTGYHQPKRQAEWLRANGVGYLVRRDDAPVVTWGAVDQAMTGRSAADEPRFDAVV